MQGVETEDEEIDQEAHDSRGEGQNQFFKLSVWNPGGTLAHINKALRENYKTLTSNCLNRIGENTLFSKISLELDNNIFKISYSFEMHITLCTGRARNKHAPEACTGCAQSFMHHK